MLQFANYNNTLMTDKNDLADDEKNLFRQAMGNVKPLKNNPKIFFKEPPPIIKPKPKVHHHIPEPIHIQNKYELVGSEEIIFFMRNGISKKTLLDLKNARERYQAVLDLHGLFPNDAATHLTKFINNQYIKGSKIILIIHGKSGKDHAPPVIKNLVHSYLQQIPEVLAYHSAKPKDGGTGAVYVLLKNSKL